MDLTLGLAAGCGDEPLKDRQARPHQLSAAQLVHGASQQRQRAVMPKRPVGYPRAEFVEVGIAARPEPADRHDLRELLSARVTLHMQALRVDR